MIIIKPNTVLPPRTGYEKRKKQNIKIPINKPTHVGTLTAIAQTGQL